MAYALTHPAITEATLPISIRQSSCWNVAPATIANYAIVAIPIALLSDTPDSLGQISFMLAKAVLYLFLLASLSLSTQQTLIFLLMIAVLGQDITQTTDELEIGESLQASIWQGQMGILRPSWVFIAYYFLILFKGGLKWVDRPVAWGILFFSSVPFVTGWVYGAFHTADAFLEIPADAKLPLFLLMTILLTRNQVKADPAFGGKLLAAFLGSVIARHTVDLAYFAFGMGAMWGDVQRVSVDSTKGTVVLLFLLSQFLILRRAQYLLGSIVAIISGLLLLVFTTRGLWLSALLGVVVFCGMMRMSKMVGSLAMMTIIGIVTIYMISIFRPENVELATKRFHSKTVAGSDNFFENQDPARYYQFINAWDATMTRWSALWGSGYGSYYTETAARFPPELKIESAFPTHSLLSGQFYTLHHFVLKMLFKYGLVGFLLLAALWVVPAWRCFLMIRNSMCSPPWDLIMPIIAFFPTSILEISWTTKGMAVSGFAIVICMSSYESFRASRRSSKQPKATGLPSKAPQLPQRRQSRAA